MTGWRGGSPWLCEMTGLDEEILSAHASDDRFRLCTLYLKAGELKQSEGDTEAACFLFTQAYVYGLETGNADKEAARARLVAHGREL